MSLWRRSSVAITARLAMTGHYTLPDFLTISPGFESSGMFKCVERDTQIWTPG